MSSYIANFIHALIEPDEAIVQEDIRFIEDLLIFSHFLLFFLFSLIFSSISDFILQLAGDFHLSSVYFRHRSLIITMSVSAF